MKQCEGRIGLYNKQPKQIFTSMNSRKMSSKNPVGLNINYIGKSTIGYHQTQTTIEEKMI